jgi:hypothetical protein
VRRSKPATVPALQPKKEKTRGLKKKSEKDKPKISSAKASLRPKGLDGTKFKPTTIPAAEFNLEFIIIPIHDPFTIASSQRVLHQ